MSKPLSVPQKFGLCVAAAVAAAALRHPPPADALAAARAHASAPLPAGGSPAANVRLGARMAASYGWTGAQFGCLRLLWDRESGWSATAENPSSGAYGIAQALGHGPTNQYPAGPANPPVSDPAAQIRWGLGYISARYGDPCGAWSHEQNWNWY